LQNGLRIGVAFLHDGRVGGFGQTIGNGADFVADFLRRESGSFSRLKVIVTFERPREELERISSMPGTVLTTPSIMSVISDSISCGAAPVFDVETETVGKSIFGNRSTPSVKKLNPPTTVKNKTITVANTGRLTQISANHCIKLLSFVLCSLSFVKSLDRGAAKDEGQRTKD